MTPRRRSPKPSAKTAPKNGTLATGVLVEQLRSEVRVIAEGLLDRPTRSELAVKFDHIDEQFAHINDRFDANEARFDRIDDQFEESKARFAKLENQIALLVDAVTWTRDHVRSLCQDAANQTQASELRVLERRVTVLEQQRVGG